LIAINPIQPSGLPNDR